MIRFKNEKKYLIIPVLLFLFWAMTLQAQQKKNKELLGDVENLTLQKPASIFDRGIAFMDAGEMQVNGVENYGMIGRRGFPYCKHGYWGEVRWIIPFLAVPPQPWATNIVTEDGNVVDRSQYYNVLESITCYFCEPEQDTNYPDWEAKDGSRTTLMGDDTWSDRPLIATSTRPNSWPQGYWDKDPMSATYGQFIETPGERHWPGYWAIDPDPESPTFGKPIENKFVSDKDIFFIMDDKWNGIRQGDENNLGYPIGFDMEVSGYCYSTTAYKDIVFFNYNLIYRKKDEVAVEDPTRQVYDQPIDSLYFGFLIDPDLPGRDPLGYTMDPWAEDDYCLADTQRNIFLMFDKDGYDRDADDINSEGPVSAYAIAFLKTPKDIGLTGYHFFTQEDYDAANRGIEVENIMYAMASGNKDLLTPQMQQKYFHGDDPQFDDLQKMRDIQESVAPGNRPDLWFTMSSGPFSISPGDTLPLHFCIVGGKDNPGALDADGFPTNPYEVRFADVISNFDKAMDLYNNKFQGTGPPRTPTLNAVGTKTVDDDGLPIVYTENGKVTLYWDDIAEKSRDILTKKRDFEGYKIYRAYVDRKLDYVDWGQEIYEVTETGEIGDILAYVPVFQCDKIDDYSGMDPYQYWFYVGNNTGIVHSWTDNDVVNGVRYRYAITAYDHWYDDPYFFNCNETSKGKSPRDLNVVDVISGVHPAGYIPANSDTVFQRIKGVGNGVIQMEIVDDNEVLGHNYTLSFTDTNGFLEYNVFDEDDGVFKVTGSTNIVSDTSGVIPEPFPFFDGVGLKIINYDQVDILESETRWTSVSADTSDYQVDIITGLKAIPANYEIRFMGENSDTNAVGTMPLPFQVWNISTDPPTQIDLLFTPPQESYPNGGQVRMWEYLTPGSSARTFTWVFSVSWKPDTVISGTDTTIVDEWGVGNPPSIGDIFTFTTKKPFKDDQFRFQTYKPSAKVIQDDDLANIKVVPNPYVISSRTELYTGSSQWNLHEVRFTHLPPECTIRIYTLTGDLVRTLEHTSPTYGEERWDLLSKENLEVSFGVYIYVVKTPSGKKRIGKMAVVK
ncbi:MAG: hypothetical protein GXO74_08200 [Calditrichaeota bacterium]|nr:hypothetical protein [Calditrichota bacterium]